MAWLWDPEHWRFRAEEARSVSEEMHHPEAKQMMQSVAQTYERLAQIAEHTTDYQSPPMQPQLTVPNLPKSPMWKRRI